MTGEYLLLAAQAFWISGMLAFAGAWLLTYAVHSTVLLGGTWLSIRRRGLRGLVWQDALWKTALVGGVLTATLQVAGGWSPWGIRPALNDAAPLRVEAERLSEAVSDEPVHVVPGRRLRLSDGNAFFLAPGTEAVSLSQAAPRFRWYHVLLGLWMLGVLASVLRLLTSARLLRHRIRGRVPVAAGPLFDLLQALRACAGIRRPLRLYRAPHLTGPVALPDGSICLPDRAFTALTCAQQHGMLAHELAHLVRRDAAWQLLASLLGCVFFFQPLNRLAARRLRTTAEYLCDDWAVGHTGQGRALAECIREVVTWMREPAGPTWAAAMADRDSAFILRIRRLLAAPARPDRVSLGRRLLLAAGILLLVSSLVPGVTASLPGADSLQWFEAEPGTSLDAPARP